jgi:hypothetical protein
MIHYTEKALSGNLTIEQQTQHIMIFMFVVSCTSIFNFLFIIFYLLLK